MRNIIRDTRERRGIEMDKADAMGKASLDMAAEGFSDGGETETEQKDGIGLESYSVGPGAPIPSNV